MISYAHPFILISKRVLDISLSLIGLVMTLCILPIIALAIKLTSKGPIFYSQLRIGTAHENLTELFYLIKFRTMRLDAEKSGGAQWATKRDTRVTSVGKFLRKTRLDELPQFINVLKGEMSLVGPRPERPGFYRQLEREIPLYSERTYGVLPGITGLAQVNQGYDECIEDVRNKLAFDHAYALSLSHPVNWIKSEVMILLKTIAVVFLGRGQ